jgi:hypothetical protein
MAFKTEVVLIKKVLSLIDNLAIRTHPGRMSRRNSALFRMPVVF